MSTKAPPVAPQIGMSGLGKSEKGKIDSGLGTGQDGFNLPTGTVSYMEGETSYPMVGRDDVPCVDPRGRAGSGDPKPGPGGPKGE